MTWDGLGIMLLVGGFVWVTGALGLYWLTEAYIMYQWEKLKMAMAIDQYNKTGEVPLEEEPEEEERW